MEYLAVTRHLSLFSMILPCFVLCYSCNISLENKDNVMPNAPLEFVNYSKKNTKITNHPISNINMPIAVFIGDIEEKINAAIINGQVLHQDTSFKTGKRAKIKFIYHKLIK